MFDYVLTTLTGSPWMSLLLLVVVVTLMVAWRRTNTSSLAKLPPTPGLALPVIGHLHLMGANPREQFAAWAKRLGPIYRLKFGSRTVIVLNGYDVLKEAFIRKADYFSDRPQTFLIEVMSNNKGFVSSSPHWRKLRKVTLDIFRQLGSGTKETEVRIESEMTRFLNSIRNSNGQPFDIRHITAECLSNVIATFVFGKDFSPDDSDVAECVRMIGDQVSLMEGAIVLNFLPFLRVLPGDQFGLRQAAKISHELDEVLAKEIEARRQHLGDENAEVQDFITAFLQRMEKHRRDTGIEGSDGMDDENLIGVLKSLFAAGTETTSSTICWAVLYLLHHPEAQSRCHKEIEDVVGPNRLPTTQDRMQCRYVEATIMETQRLCSISPFSIYHTASADVQLNGFLIPKESIVMPSLDSALHSHEIWGDPFNFRPDRFLDETTNQIIRREELVPFSLGKRACLGESMAKQEMFLFLSSLIHQFSIQTRKDSTLPPLDYRFGLNCSPLPFEICFVPR